MAAYDAFVSYSHAKDKPIAAALQSVIQRLGKPWYRRRALRIFRDDTSLSATPSLWPSIEQALGNSRFLILLASPEAAASPWVNKEVSHWLVNKSASTILIAVTDGKLFWNKATGDFVQYEDLPLPPVLTGRFGSEPKWVDLRAYRDGAGPRDSRFIEAGAEFAAAIHGLPKEDLLSQEVRQQRRALRLASGAAATLAVLIAIAGWQWWEAKLQRDRAERNFVIARNAADHMVFRIARGLRDTQGMRVETVRQILDAAQVMMDELVRAAPDDPPLQRSRAAMLIEFVDTYIRAGDLPRARAAADESLAIMRKIAAIDPVRAGWQHDVSVSLTTVGDVRLQMEERPGALAAYEESLAIMRKLVATDQGNIVWQRSMSVNLDRVGDTLRGGGQIAGARGAYEESLAIRRTLAAIDMGNIKWQRDLSVSLGRVGIVRLAAGDRSGARAAFEEGLAIARQVAAADPDNTEWQRDVSLGLDRVGGVRMQMGERLRALTAYEESLAIVRKLAAADSGNTEWQVDLVQSLYIVSTASNPSRAQAVLREALAIVDTLARNNRLTAGHQHWPELVRETLAKLARQSTGAR